MSKKRFSKINIEISNICNLQCSFCPEVVRTKGVMDPDVFSKILGQVGSLTDQVCLHLMGDPLVHPRLEEFVSIAEHEGVPLYLVTNGVLLRDLQAKILLSPIIRQVNFSLHSFPDNFPDQDPGSYLEKIFRFTERAFVERPELYINFRLWNLDSPEDSPQRFISKNREILNRIQARFGGDGIDAVDVRIQKSYRVLNRLYLHFDTEFIWPSLELPVIGERGTCYGLSSHFGILVDGTVVPCCLDKEGKIPLGNIKEDKIIDILESSRATKILKGFRDRKLTEDLCRRCQYIERFS